MIDDEKAAEQTNVVSTTPQKPTPKIRKIGRTLLWSGVALALAVATCWQVAVYFRTYYERILRHDEQLIEQAQRMESLKNELETNRKLHLEQIQLLQAKIDNLSAQLLENGAVALPLRLSEVLYLVRLADHRLSFFHDVKTTLHLLKSANEKMSALKDPSLQPIQEKLSKTIDEVQNKEDADAVEISLKINEAIDALALIPVSSARAPTSQPPQSTTKEPGWQRGLQQTWEKLKKLVTVKQLNTKAKPFLLPEEHALLLWNVRLELEQAKLAAWRGEEAAYKRSLKMAIAWIKQNLNTEQEATRNVLKMLEILAEKAWVEQKSNMLELVSVIQKALDEVQKRKSQ